MGRPSKFTEGRRGIILAALRDGQTYQVASAMADVNPATVSMWLGQEDKLWFRDQCKQAEADSEKRLVSVMQSHALGIGVLLCGCWPGGSLIGGRFPSATRGWLRSWTDSRS